MSQNRNEELRFLSCDWGTSNFRLRLIDLSSRAVLAETTNDKGIALFSGLESSAYVTHLCDAFSTLEEKSGLALRNEPVFVSGMASSSIGWKELPYAEFPFSLNAESLISMPLESFDYHKHTYVPILISGLASSEDVMRGEETELLGMMSRPEALVYADDCWVVLPGTHSKHIRIVNQQVVDFHTHMTGELFNLLRQQSVLKHSLKAEVDNPEFNEESFISGVERVMAKGLSASLFKVRSSSLLKEHSVASNFNFLSGMLIGNEMQALRFYDGPILISASGAMIRGYNCAAAIMGLKQYHPMSTERHHLLAVEGQALLLKR